MGTGGLVGGAEVALRPPQPTPLSLQPCPACLSLLPGPSPAASMGRDRHPVQTARRRMWGAPSHFADENIEPGEAKGTGCPSHVSDGKTEAGQPVDQEVKVQLSIRAHAQWRA